MLKLILAGMDGLKRYLLENRQDQFARAMVHKLASYSLGRPLSFSDRAEVERITAELRQRNCARPALVRDVCCGPGIGGQTKETFGVFLYS